VVLAKVLCCVAPKFFFAHHVQIAFRSACLPAATATPSGVNPECPSCRNKQSTSPLPTELFNCRSSSGYLEVTMDDDLGFRTHAAAAAAKGPQTVRALSFLCRYNWSVPAYVAHHFVLVAVMPKMLCGSPIWWTGSATVRGLLERTYLRIARWITGLPISTRVSKLLTAAGRGLL
jgi:hypothetical protein